MSASRRNRPRKSDNGIPHQEQRELERALRLSLLESNKAVSGRKRKKLQSPSNVLTVKKTVATVQSADRVFKDKDCKKVDNSKSKEDSHKSEECVVSNKPKPTKPHLRPSSAYVPPPPQELLKYNDNPLSLLSDEEFGSSCSDSEDTFELKSKKSSKLKKKKTKRKKIIKTAATVCQTDLHSMPSTQACMGSDIKSGGDIKSKQEIEPVLFDLFSPTSPASSEASGSSWSKDTMTKNSAQKHTKSVHVGHIVKKSPAKNIFFSSNYRTNIRSSTPVAGDSEKRILSSDDEGLFGHKNLSLSSSDRSQLSCFQAQRKFPCNQMHRTTVTNNDDSLSSSDETVMTREVPKTEDFLLYLCLRSSSALPKHLTCFDVPWTPRASKRPRRHTTTRSMAVAKKTVAKILF